MLVQAGLNIGSKHLFKKKLQLLIFYISMYSIILQQVFLFVVLGISGITKAKWQRFGHLCNYYNIDCADYCFYSIIKEPHHKKICVIMKQ